ACDAEVQRRRPRLEVVVGGGADEQRRPRRDNRVGVLAGAAPARGQRLLRRAGTEGIDDDVEVAAEGGGGAADQADGAVAGVDGGQQDVVEDGGVGVVGGAGGPGGVGGELDGVGAGAVAGVEGVVDDRVAAAGGDAHRSRLVLEDHAVAAIAVDQVIADDGVLHAGEVHP